MKRIRTQTSPIKLICHLIWFSKSVFFIYIYLKYCIMWTFSVVRSTFINFTLVYTEYQFIHTPYTASTKSSLCWLKSLDIIKCLQIPFRTLHLHTFDCCIRLISIRMASIAFARVCVSVSVYLRSSGSYGSPVCLSLYVNTLRIFIMKQHTLLDAVTATNT